MQCNIDAKGRAVRMRGGIVCLVLGLVACGAAVLGAPRWPSVTIGVVLAAAGLFQVFESRKGWCALRAMGVKTPI